MSEETISWKRLNYTWSDFQRHQVSRDDMRKALEEALKDKDARGLAQVLSEYLDAEFYPKKCC